MLRSYALGMVAVATLAGASLMAGATQALAGPGPSARAITRSGSAPIDRLSALDRVDPFAGLRNQRVNDDSTPPEPQFDPSVAASRVRRNVAVAAFSDRSHAGVQIARTRDGGRHWTTTSLTARDKAAGNPCFTYQPQVAFSRRDLAFYLLVGCSNTEGLAEAQLLKSVDNGATWTGALSSSLVVANHAPGETTIDQSIGPDWFALAVDNAPASPHYGRIYAGYVRFHFAPPEFTTADSCPAHVAYTDDVPTIVPGDASWTDVPVMPPGSATDASAAADLRLTTDDRGGVDVVYANENCVSYVDYGISFTRSPDGGGSYPTVSHITRPTFFTDNPDPNDVLPGKDAQVFISPSVDFNARTRSLNVVYHNFRGQETSASDISYQRSRDYGSTWSAARTISTQPDGSAAPNDQFLPWITADPVTGFLHAIWLDNRNDPGNRLIETFQAFSANDGRTWRNVDISTASWDPHVGEQGTPSVGSLSGVAAFADHIYPLWNDARDPGPVDQGHGGLDIFTNVERHGSPAQH